MKRIQLVALAAATALMVGSVIAGSVHLKGGANAEPSFTDLGIRLMASGALAGLGFGDVFIQITAQAAVASTCTNKGENPAPGQNPAPTTVTGSVSIPAPELKNGNTPFAVTTNAPQTPIPGAPGCPNQNWTETIDDLAFTAAMITVRQPGSTGPIVLTVVCTFDPATTDGSVPAGDVSCTQQ